MSKKNKNRKTGDVPGEVGLRDYFAGTALQALIYASEDDVEDVDALRENAPGYARRAYLLADAMLAARREGEEVEVESAEGETAEAEDGEDA
jgi:hypothetical protein